MEMLLQGLYNSLSPENLFACVLGVLLGTVTGILPGIGPLGAIALLLPLSFGMNTLPTLILFAGIYYGSMYGGAITSILLNIPGEDSAVVTCIEGYAMAKKGRGGAAIAIAAIGSFIAGTLGVVGLSLFAPVLAKLSLNFGPCEYFAISIFGLIVLTNLIGYSALKSSLMAVVGIMLGTVGMDGLTGISRFTLQISGLQSGLDFTLVIMGLFGMSEIFQVMAEQPVASAGSRKINFLKQYPDREELQRSLVPICRGGIIGFFIGLLPGPSAVLSSFLAYAAEKKCHKQPEKFGQGMIEGVAGPEAANNSAAAANLIPLLALGLPFSPTSAILLSGFTLHGITPGPTLLTQHADIFWGLVASMYVGNLLLLVINLPLVGIFTSLLRVPVNILMPIVMLIMLTSVYALTQNFFDLGLLILFGFLGFLLKNGGYEPAAFVIGFILGPRIEWGLVQGLLIGDGQLSAFLLRPLSGTILLLSASLLLYKLIQAANKIKKTGGIS